MKIKESDFLWKMYLRYYRGCVDIVEPHGFCAYFWKAMGGAFLTLFVDVAIFITLPIVLALTVGSFYLLSFTAQNYDNAFFIVPTSLLTTLCVLSCIFLPYMRFYWWLEKRSKTTHQWFVYVMILISFGCWTHVFLKDQIKWKEPNWSDVLLTAGISVAVLILIGFFVFVYNFINNPISFRLFFRQIKIMFLSVKRGVCPTVDAPESFKNRWKNCGDG